MPDKDMEYWKEFYNEEYWERGTLTGKSGYDNWDICVPWDDKFVDHFQRVFPIRDKNMLDLGCALGGIVLALNKKGANAFGMDLSEYAIQKGQKIFPELVGRTVISSSHQLPYDNDSFDIVLSNQVFEHIPEGIVPQMMSEISRVMRPGAIAWIGLVLADGAHRPFVDGPDHITLKTLDWWKERITEAGLIFDNSIDEAFRSTELQFFREYGWHSFSFRKKQNGR
jgi:SAM-dependent methyltransferase